jgi:hypothetical protein
MLFLTAFSYYRFTTHGALHPPVELAGSVLLLPVLQATPTLLPVLDGTVDSPE